MLNLLYFAVVVAATMFGFAVTRNFVRNRLRFVDAVRQPWVPWVVGAVLMVVTAPIAWFLPLVTKATTVLFSIGAGVGTASGVKALKRGE